MMPRLVMEDPEATDNFKMHKFAKQLERGPRLSLEEMRGASMSFKQ